MTCAKPKYQHDLFFIWKEMYMWDLNHFKKIWNFEIKILNFSTKIEMNRNGLNN
jgi:hypothetical protein